MYFDNADDEPVTTASDEQSSGQLSTADGEYIDPVHSCEHYSLYTLLL